MPKVLDLLKGKYFFNDSIADDELYLVKKCNNCKAVVLAKEEETFIAMSPKKQKSQRIKCPVCYSSIIIKEKL